MSKTTRHRDFWRMRQLAKHMRALHRLPETPTQFERVRQSPEHRKLDWEFDRLWANYGYKSMVNDKRRRVSTRRSNSEYVRELRRAKRRTASQRLRFESELIDLDASLWPVKPSRR